MTLKQQSNYNPEGAVDSNLTDELVGGENTNEQAGYGNCTNCTCVGYQDALTGNDYCKCGHAYSDHW